MSAAATRTERRFSLSSLPSVIFHKYQIEKQVSDGSFGEVYRAFRKEPDGTKGIPVTIRTFRENHKAMEELDQSELDIVSQMQHVNIVRILDTVWNIQPQGVELYLVTELCSLGTLDTYILDHGRFSELQVQDFLQQISLGLNALRDHGILHRDLKPSNILLQKRSEHKGSLIYKISDVGLSRLFFDDQAGVAFDDSPTFIAPEVLKTSASLAFNRLLLLEDSKIDVWSVGVLVLLCLNAEVPFNGADLSQYTSDKEIDVPSQIPRGTSHELHNLIVSLLRFEPIDRLDFASFLRSPFLRQWVWFAAPYKHVLPCSGMVTSLCCDDQVVLAGLECGLIEVFDRRSLRRFRRLDFHRKTVTALAANRDIVISGSQDTTIVVWSKESFERLQVLYHHRNAVIGIEIIGSSAYSACLDGTHTAFSIDFRKLFARKNGFGQGQRRYSIQEHSNEEFREDLEFRESRTGRVYKAHWRDHDHMHTVAGIIVILVWVAEDDEFRPFHILSSRAFTSVRPQLEIRIRDDGNEHLVRKINFESHIRQVQTEGDQIFSLKTIWERMRQGGKLTDTVNCRALLQPSCETVTPPTWFCVRPETVAFYNKSEVTILEYKAV